MDGKILSGSITEYHFGYNVIISVIMVSKFLNLSYG